MKTRARLNLASQSRGWLLGVDERSERAIYCFPFSPSKFDDPSVNSIPFGRFDPPDTGSRLLHMAPLAC